MRDGLLLPRSASNYPGLCHDAPYGLVNTSRKPNESATTSRIMIWLAIVQRACDLLFPSAWLIVAVTAVPGFRGKFDKHREFRTDAAKQSSVQRGQARGREACPSALFSTQWAVVSARYLFYPRSFLPPKHSFAYGVHTKTNSRAGQTGTTRRETS